MKNLGGDLISSRASPKTENRPALARETVSNGIAGPFSSSTSYYHTTEELKKQFEPKHKASVVLADSLQRLGYVSRSDRAMQCGTLLSFAHAVDDDGCISPHGKLVEANFCRDRLCPMCSWRRSYKIYGQVSRIMDVIQGDYKFLFLTLTVPNCSPEDLADTITEMYKGWSRFIRQKAFKGSVRGFFRALEITRNPVTGFFHPHFHVVLVVNLCYFSKTDYYIPRDEWLHMWQRAMNNPSITQVDIRRARSKLGDASGLGSAVAEIAKYAVKSSDYLYPDDSRLTDDIVSVLVPALRGRRLCHFGGIMADVHKALKLDDAEDGDLIHLDGDIRSDISYLIMRFGWTAGCYKLTELELIEGNNK